MSSMDAWVKEYSDQKNQLCAKAPWLEAIRQRAMDLFAENGWPNNRMEGWRHTSLVALDKETFARPDDNINDEKINSVINTIKTNEPSHWMVFVDGVYSDKHSYIDKLPSGSVLKPVSQALSDYADDIQAILSESDQKSSPAALNMALTVDGAFIKIGRGESIELPVNLIFISSGNGRYAFPRSYIIADKGALACVTEHYVSLDPSDSSTSLTNAVTHLRLSEGSNITHLKLQTESKSAFHIAYTDAHQEGKSVFNSHSMAFGSKLARNDITTSFNGTHCETLLNGLYLVDGRRHIDHTTHIDHKQPHGISREHYRGVLSDFGRGVFCGRVRVGHGAAGTDSLQSSDSLLLSKMARADSKPELEIYADDVKCAHGATVGQLDENSLFYLRCRGLDESFARNLLIYAFAAEVVNRITAPSVREQVSALIQSSLPGSISLGDI